MSKIESNEEFHLRQLEKHLDRSKNKREDSVKRFDVLIVSLSTLGLGFILNFTKEVTTEKLNWTYLAQGIFILSIISNLISQVLSIQTNTAAEKTAKQDLDFERQDYFKEKAIDEESNIEKKSLLENERESTMKKHNQELDCTDKKVYRLDYYIKNLNIVSFVLLICGIIIFGIHLLTQ